ncbi:hypothetical protein [Streptococcus xiaochunlingii]|uniref:IgA FC receptor n=1 Tax=Streptococcus xiaochunlingii TaxID=2589788 RepID=A0ABY2YEC9_9STRE|nr:hypothetical protein [Streptococcus xiaochunlingii]TPE37762.1 hypothetical protein FJR71_01855 [Streptococcus xiaochunlingii]
MNKNRIFIIAASAVAILGSFLPWASASAGALGSMTISGTQGDGWLIIFLAIVSIVLSCLKNYEKPMEKPFAIGVIVIGAIQTIISIIDVFNINKYAVNFGGFGISLGFGLILCLLAGIATVATGLLAMSGGKITKGTFQELASTTKGFAQSIASSVQSPQQPGHPGQQQWQQPQQGFGQPAPGQGFQQAPQAPQQLQQGFQQAPQAPQQPQQGFQQAPQQPQQGFQQAPQQPQQGFQQAPQQPQPGFQQAPQQPQPGFQQAPQQPQPGFQQAPQQPQQEFQQAPQQAWQPQEQQQPQQPEQPTTEPGQE